MSRVQRKAMTGKGVVDQRGAEIGPPERRGRGRGCGHRDRHERNRTKMDLSRGRWRWKTRRVVSEGFDLLGELPCRRVGICFHHLQRVPGPWAIRSPPLPDIGQGRRADGETDGQ